MKRSVACVIDRDIMGAVRRGDVSKRRAMYDLSVVRALKRLGAEVHLVSADEAAPNTLRRLMQLAPDIVFNLAFSATPAEPALAGALELLGRPFTGSGSLAIGLANDKILSRQLMRSAGIPVPDYVVLSPGRRTRSFELARPWIVKPASLANSHGIRASSIVTTREQALRRAERNWQRFGVPSLCETFVVGREFQVGLIEMHRSFGITAVAELCFEGAAPGYGFKSEPFMVRGERHRLFDVSQHIARLPVPAMTELSSIARRAAEVLKLRGYAKIDIRMDGQGRFFVLEANANPGLWPGIAIWRRPSFRLNVQRIMAAALDRADEGARC